MPQPPATTPTSRRTILGGAAVLGAGAVLAACAGEAEVVDVDASPAPTSGANAGGTPVAKVADVPVGGGVYSADARAFVTQPEAGTFKGFDALCTHKQCAMTKIEGTTISCQCHGSEFSALDGSVITGPATTPLPAVKVVEKDGALFVQG